MLFMLNSRDSGIGAMDYLTQKLDTEDITVLAFEFVGG